MLVLERKIQEGFWIDQRIFVKVLGIGRRRVKLGIEAPSDLSIMRSELGPTPAQASAAARSREPAHSVDHFRDVVGTKAGTATQPE